MASTKSAINKIRNFRASNPSGFLSLLKKETMKLEKIITMKSKKILLAQYDSQIDGNGTKWKAYTKNKPKNKKGKVKKGKGGYTHRWRASVIKTGNYKRGPFKENESPSSRATPSGPILVLSGKTRENIKNNSVVYKGGEIFDITDTSHWGSLGIDDNTLLLIANLAAKGRDCTQINEVTFLDMVDREMDNMLIGMSNKIK